MNARIALPFLLLGLFAAAPARGQAIHFETAQAQLDEVFEEFGFDEAPVLFEDTGDKLSYEIYDGEFLFNVTVREGDRVVIYAFWTNEAGVRRSTLTKVNDWNFASWSSKATFAEDGRYLLLSAPPVEMELTVDNLIDLLETFQIDMQGFNQHLAG